MRVDRRVRRIGQPPHRAGHGLLVFVPIYLVFVNSLKTRAESSSMGVGLPAVPQWENFATVIEEGNLVVAFFNSLLYSLAATAICVVLASMAAYVLARRRTRRHRLIYLLLIMGIAMPTNFVTLMQVMQWTQPDQHADRHHPALRGDADPVQRLPRLRLHRARSRGNWTRPRSSTAAGRFGPSSGSSSRC